MEEDDPPVITAVLANDTGASNADGITSDPTISGTVTDDSKISELLLTVTPVGSGVSGGPIDVTADIDPVDGSFLFDRSALETLLGQAMLDDGYTITLAAQDALGNASSQEWAAHAAEMMAEERKEIEGRLALTIEHPRFVERPIDDYFTVRVGRPAAVLIDFAKEHLVALIVLVVPVVLLVGHPSLARRGHVASRRSKIRFLSTFE